MIFQLILPSVDNVSFSPSLFHYSLFCSLHFFSPSVDNLSGPTSPSGIKPEDLTDDVFSYIFLAKPLPTGVSTPIPQELLQSMRDVRVSIQGIISFFSSKSSAAIHLFVPLFCIHFPCETNHPTRSTSILLPLFAYRSFLHISLSSLPASLLSTKLLSLLPFTIFFTSDLYLTAYAGIRILVPV